MWSARAIVSCSLSLAFAAHAAARVDAAVREPQLDALIAGALASSPIVDARRSEVAAARHDVQAARWQFAPSLSTQVQQGSGSSYQYASSLRADQRLYTGGRLDADLDGARSRRDGAVLAVQEAGLGVALQIVGAWQSLQAAQGQVQAITAYRERLAALNDTIGRRIDSGVSPVTEQSLMNARLAQSQNELAAARAAAQSARATLRKLAGNAAPVAVRADLLADAPAAAPVCADNADGDARVQSAADRHPALRRMAQDIEAARHALDSQRAALKPTLTLRVEQPVGPMPESVSRAARVSLLLEYTTDAGLSARSRVNAGDDRLASLNNQSLALRRDIDQAIRSECADQGSVRERVAGLAQARGFTQDVLGSYTRLFLAGKRGWLDVLNAAREDFDNELAAFGASAALRASVYRLSLLSGEYELGLPEPEDEPATAPLLATQPTPADEKSPS
jgi:adhesin transport system outer membrane protein